MAVPDDAIYARTDASVLGVDLGWTAVPVFVSVLVDRNGDRAPDRLAELWGPRTAMARRS